MLLSIIGILMMVALFGGIFIAAWHELGIKTALLTFGAVITIILWITGAVFLILG